MKPKKKTIRISHPRATTYTIYMPDRRDDITIQARESEMLNGARRKVRWAVMRAGFAWTKDEAWEYEPLPSSRTDEYLKLARYSTLPQAMRAARRAAMVSLENPLSPSSLRTKRSGGGTQARTAAP